jgi:hypothetical protein
VLSAEALLRNGTSRVSVAHTLPLGFAFPVAVR